MHNKRSEVVRLSGHLVSLRAGTILLRQVKERVLVETADRRHARTAVAWFGPGLAIGLVPRKAQVQDYHVAEKGMKKVAGAVFQWDHARSRIRGVMQSEAALSQVVAILPRDRFENGG